ncbi:MULTISPECIES: cytidine deaminase [Aeromicrobium]|uniref:Cytidine deaminase n=2 Tax=Aeromicrobium TaxID=2040 RepID=A0A8I0JZ65_9ACTN|nr:MULTISPECIES: cytidine deaminase [Aeromicrobium]MBC9225637.1 cytidine deaminase [Aeromicrobium senzhongii]MCD9153458.1 cytidine deaminase [Aeromicrobium duanguangcaii]MCL3836555.1 cytidine deaminase [Aeromicrobium duanguangcaii]MCQ3997746.1 cytidine deaminase [Aeromicrobium sp. 636]MTB87673.1 cytidine deaminase [Aeromicrobium senzhongii]
MDLPPEDAKLVTLARTSRARLDVAQGAAVRDLDGRTYAAATVNLDTLTISAVDLAVAMAVSSGAKGLEAVALVTEGDVPVGLDAVIEFGGVGVTVVVADPKGTVDTVLTT